MINEGLISITFSHLKSHPAHSSHHITHFVCAPVCVCARVRVRAAPSSAQSSKSSAIEHLNQFSWRRTSWKSTVPFTKNTNRNQDEWAGLANHTDYTDAISGDWPESLGALCCSWAGGGLAFAGAAGPPAGRATGRLLSPAKRKTRRVRSKTEGDQRCSQDSRRKQGETCIGYRSDCIRYEQAASPDKSGGCSMTAELWMLECTTQSRQKDVCACVCVCVCVCCLCSLVVVFPL